MPLGTDDVFQGPSTFTRLHLFNTFSLMILNIMWYYVQDCNSIGPNIVESEKGAGGSHFTFSPHQSQVGPLQGNKKTLELWAWGKKKKKKRIFKQPKSLKYWIWMLYWFFFNINENVISFKFNFCRPIRLFTPLSIFSLVCFVCPDWLWDHRQITNS